MSKQEIVIYYLEQIESFMSINKKLEKQLYYVMRGNTELISELEQSFETTLKLAQEVDEKQKQMAFFIRYFEPNSWKDGLDDITINQIEKIFGGYNKKEHTDLHPLLGQREKKINNLLNYFQNIFKIEELNTNTIFMLCDAFKEVSPIYEYEVQNFYDMRQGLEDSKRLNEIFNNVANSNGDNITTDDLNLVYECNRTLYTENTDGFDVPKVPFPKGHMLEGEISYNWCDRKRNKLLLEYADKIKKISWNLHYKPRIFVGHYSLKFSLDFIREMLNKSKSAEKITGLFPKFVNGTVFLV